MTLEEIIIRLSNNVNVDALLLCGSTATGKQTKSSDHDLVLIVKEKPEKLLSLFTYIDSLPADIFFYSLTDIKRIISDKQAKEGGETWLMHWLSEGKISFDKSGIVTKLQEIGKDIRKVDNVSLAKSYEYKINYNLLTNTRYFESGDELYHAALEIRFLYSIAEVLVGYFAMRDIYWEGEKNAILYLRKNDPAYLKVFESACREVSLSDKYESYKKLVEQSFYGEYKKWNKDIVASIDGDFNEFWIGLISK